MESDGGTVLSSGSMDRIICVRLVGVRKVLSTPGYRKTVHFSVVVFFFCFLLRTNTRMTHDVSDQRSDRSGQFCSVKATWFTHSLQATKLSFLYYYYMLPGRKESSSYVDIIVNSLHG